MSYARINTSLGPIDVELFDDGAPMTVANFRKLTDSHFYDGIIFHRIIPDLMIQAGNPQETGRGVPGYEFVAEINREILVRGRLAMANAGPNTNGSHFFIVTGDDALGLEGKHTVFGQVAAGMDTVDAIEALPTDDHDRPLNPPEIESIDLDRGGPIASATARASNSGIGIFVCYRRDDARWPAGRLADALRDRFGDTNVFMDVDTIRVGNWRQQIDDFLRACAAVIVVIGPHWLDEFGNRRAEDDQVRYEIAEALRLNKVILPASVDRANLPSRALLPDDVAGLSDVQAYELGIDVMWRPTVAKLIDDLSEYLGL